MATLPTSRFPTWADGAADVTDPGSSKQATGWVEGEAPAADHTNWLHNARGEWLDFIRQSTRHTIIAENWRDKNVAAFGTDILAMGIVWDPTLEVFFASVLENTTNDLIAYQSSDGITWGSGTTVNLTDTSTLGPTQIAYCPDNAKIGIGSEAGFHLSSTNAVSGFSQTPTGTFASIADVSDLIWDDTNNLWIACGFTTAVAGYIETAAAAGTSWTQRDTEAAVAAQSIAHATAGTYEGNTVVAYQGSDLIQYSSNGTTWTRMTTGPSKTFSQVWWAPFVDSSSDGIFLAYEPSGDTVYWSADGDAWALSSLGTVHDMFVCENCIVYIDESTEHGWFVGSPEAVWSDAPIIEMGIDLSAAKWDPVGTMWRWQGSTKAFSYRGTSFLINSTFGY